MKNESFNIFKQLAFCTVGSVIYAAAVSLFLDPNGIVPGGFTGLAMILGEFVPIPTGTFTLILNIPLLVIGIFVFGLRFLGTTIYSVAASSIMIDVLMPFGPLTDNLMLASLAGGALMAIGLELVLLQGATTGGTDIVVKLLRRKFRAVSAGRFFLISDGAIVLLSMLVFKNIDAGLYAAVTIIVSSSIMDMIIYGRDQAKLVIIVSDKNEEIADRILKDLDVGATFLQGSGAYSGSDKKIIMCVVKKWTLPQLMKIVKAVDEKSFSIISTANEVFGEGYKPHDGELI